MISISSRKRKLKELDQELAKELTKEKPTVVDKHISEVKIKFLKLHMSSIESHIRYLKGEYIRSNKQTCLNCITHSLSLNEADEYCCGENTNIILDKNNIGNEIPENCPNLITNCIIDE